MLLEAEGQTAPPSSPRKGAVSGSSRLAVERAVAALRDVVVAPAYADDASQAAILATLEKYRAATEARDLAKLGAVYKDFPPEQQSAQQRYFDNVRDLKVTIENPEIAVVGDEAVVSYTRTDDFVDARTGRPMHVSVRLTKILVHSAGDWRLAPGK
jgi:ketosteroid isomerase-like protein